MAYHLPYLLGRAKDPIYGQSKGIKIGTQKINLGTIKDPDKGQQKIARRDNKRSHEGKKFAPPIVVLFLYMKYS